MLTKQFGTKRYFEVMYVRRWLALRTDLSLMSKYLNATLTSHFVRGCRCATRNPNSTSCFGWNGHKRFGALTVSTMSLKDMLEGAMWVVWAGIRSRVAFYHNASIDEACSYV
eukprot:IDg7184t1